MDKVKVKLLRPLDGAEAGSTASYDAADAERLASYGAVEITGKSAGAAPENKAEPAVENKSEGKALSAMSKAELIETATNEYVAIETDDNKADLIRKIEAARAG